VLQYHGENTESDQYRAQIRASRTQGIFVALPRNLFPKNFGAPDLASKFPRGPRLAGGQGRYSGQSRSGAGLLRQPRVYFPGRDSALRARSSDEPSPRVHPPELDLPAGHEAEEQDRRRAYRLSLRIVVPISVVAIDANRAKFNRSFKATTPMITANTIPVSRSAETNASGASVSPQMTSQDDP
jgi:hypothetical protein